jgi:hypothetical protein
MERYCKAEFINLPKENHTVSSAVTMKITLKFPEVLKLISSGNRFHKSCSIESKNETRSTNLVFRVIYSPGFTFIYFENQLINALLRCSGIL